MAFRKIGIIIPLVAVLLSGIWALFRPPLRVLAHQGRVIIDVQTLGEYNSSLSCLELTECGSDAAIWRLRTSTTPIELWAFPLQAGMNPVLPNEFYQGSISEETLARSELESVGTTKQADYRVVVPKDISTFALNRSTCYRISIEPTGTLRWLFRASETFSLQ